MEIGNALYDITIRQIKIFINAAETGSFSKTAAKMLMTQSMISKAIAHLEHVVGFKLFNRSPQGVQVTNAGRILYQEWKNLDKSLSRSIVLASTIGEGEFEQIMISDHSTSVKKEYLWPYVDRFLKKYPKVDFVIETIIPGGGLEKLLTSHSDLLFSPYCERDLFMQNNLNVKHVIQVPADVWIHKNNPLYNREHIEIEDLKDETFIIVSPMVLTHYEKMVFDLCKQGGFRPNNIIHVGDIAAATLYLKLGRGILIRDRTFDSVETSDIHRYELKNTIGGVVMAWKKDLSNKAALRFISMYED